MLVLNTLHNYAMRIIILLLLIFSISLARAKDRSEQSEKDSLENNNVCRSQIYIAPIYRLHQFVETSSSFAGASAGIFFNDRFDIRFTYSKNIDNFIDDIIFPVVYQYDQTNLSIDANYTFLKGKIRPLAGLGYTYAMTSWEATNDSDDKFTDNIFILDFFIGARWFISKVISLHANASYNIGMDVNIIGLKEDDYNGFGAELMLKINILRL